ncbi:MAG: nuclear transport factor 2 family protein [Acidimicrobiales bacterium]
MDHRTLSDRIEISDFLTRYADAVDRERWDDWKKLFTDDAHIDYSSSPGGIAGGREEVAAWLEECMKLFSVTQHLISNQDVTIDGDTATVRAMFYNPMQFKDGPSFFCGGWYNHDLVRTDDGWRSRRLIEEMAWTEGLPSGAQ